jgi:hypothetical protein
MSEDHTIEAGQHTAHAFKALLSAALVVADAQRQRAVREMRRLETEAREREATATQRQQVDTTLGRHDTTKNTTKDASRDLGTDTGGAADGRGGGLDDPLVLAEAWAAAEFADTKNDLDTHVRATGVDPDAVRREHAQQRQTPAEAGRSSAEPAGRAADRVQHEGVWQQGSPEVAKAGLSYTREPGQHPITPGLTPQRRTPAAAKTTGKNHDLGR